MKNLSCELEKMNSYSGVEYAQRLTELYREFANDEKQIDRYIENRARNVAASADEAIARAVRYKQALLAGDSIHENVMA
jgi:guanylate kinase